MRACGRMLFAVALLASTAVAAHHSTNNIYHEDRTIELEGKVVKWRFVNPHPSLTIEVIDEHGQAQQWDVSYGGLAVVHMTQRGYSADTFKPGDMIVVQGHPARAPGVYGLLMRGNPTREDGTPIP